MQVRGTRGPFLSRQKAPKCANECATWLDGCKDTITKIKSKERAKSAGTQEQKCAQGPGPDCANKGADVAR